MSFWDDLSNLFATKQSDTTEFREGSMLDTWLTGYQNKNMAETKAITTEATAKSEAIIIDAKKSSTMTESTDVAGLYNKVSVQTKGGSGDQSIPDGDNSTISAGSKGLLGSTGIDVTTGSQATNIPKGGDTANPANPAKTAAQTSLSGSGLSDIMPLITIMVIALFAYMVLKEVV